MKYFIDKIQGHQQNSGTVGGCQPSSSCHPCVPCGWSSSWWGSHPSSSSSSSCHLMSPLSPCGTCGSGTSLIHCGMVISVWDTGALGVCCRSLGVLLGGSLGRTAAAAIAPSAAAGLAIRACGELLGNEPNAHLLVVMQGGG